MRKSRKVRNSDPAAPSPYAEPAGNLRPDCFYIVGIGASAGGLEALEQFFTHLPCDTGMAFVLVPHLEPTHKGMMPELLERRTKMGIVEARDGMQVKPNCVYVIPPNADMAILHGKLQILQPVAPRGLRTPIDIFFRHLAQDQREKAIGIILSGMGSDGTLGIRAIKEQLGMVMAQDPASAKYDAMPRSAINTGQVDCVASAENLPAKLLQYIHHVPQPLEDRETPEAEPSAALQKMFLLLRSHSGNDFSCYKKTTVHRRIERRMGVHHFDTLARYVRFLQENPQEVETLYRELLIGVTGFFRDPPLFDILKEKVLPRLLEGRSADVPLRVWNPACSTGEETYSLAMLLMECAAPLKMQNKPAIQIFATDIDKDAIEKARQGVFSTGIAADVSPDRLQRFFVQEGESYRIRNSVRDLVVFAPQNMLVDPPFTKMDIVCCRNLLIYLNIDTQMKLLPLMHYALNPGGVLVLGSAESTGGYSHLFAPMDGKWKIFQRLEAAGRRSIQMPVRPSAPGQPALAIEKVKATEMDTLYAAQRALLDLYGPPAVIVNAEGDIVYVSARTGHYLEPASGKINLNLFAMAREGLRDELVLAVQNAATRRASYTTRGVKVKSNGGWRTVDLVVRPLVDKEGPRDLLLVVFQEAILHDLEEAAEKAEPPPDAPLETVALEKELRHTREHLHVIIREMQATQEELRSANEELQSSNEELQSSNEELNSSKEELQSLNEEMQTVNAELQGKMEELSRSNSDMKNLLNGIEIATIFVGNDLSIKRFTPEATKIVNLAASDVGRPLNHFTTLLKYDRLEHDVQSVLDKLVSKQEMVEARNGRWYNLRILPYRTTDNVIDGVVMTFADITELKQLNKELGNALAKLQKAQKTLRQSEERHRAMVSASNEVLYQMSPDWSEMRQLNSRGFMAEMPQPSRNWLQDYFHPDDHAAVKAAIDTAIRDKSIFELEHRVRRLDCSFGWVFSRAVPMLDTNGEIMEWFGAASDITPYKDAELRAAGDAEGGKKKRT